MLAPGEVEASEVEPNDDSANAISTPSWACQRLRRPPHHDRVGSDHHRETLDPRRKSGR